MNSQRWAQYYTEGGLGFALNYKKTFKREYLPGCVQHSQALFWGLAAGWLFYYYRQNVSLAGYSLTLGAGMELCGRGPDRSWAETLLLDGKALREPSHNVD